MTVDGPEGTDTRPESVSAQFRRVSTRRSSERLDGARNLPPEVHLAAAVSLGGAGILAASVVYVLAPADSCLLLATLWTFLFLAIVFFVRVWRPEGLFRLKPSDLLIGVAGGVLLRLVQGVLTNANSSAFPSDQLLMEGHVAEWFMSNVLLLGVAGPLLEEFYFRGALLILVTATLCRFLAEVWANLMAVAASTAAFVVIHYAYAPQLATQGLSLALVGSVACVIVLATRRIWGAVTMHATYNLCFLGLVALGSVGAGN